MRVRLSVSWVLVAVAAVVHAQPVSAIDLTAAIGGKAELQRFVSAYLLGFVLSVAWLAFRAFRRLRADVRALRGSR